VLYQDADISQEELDWLVHVRVWGEDCYELANFTDDDLVPALTTLAQQQQNPRVTDPAWGDDLRRELGSARAAHLDIKVPMGHMRIREDKVGLARLIWPTLLANCEAEMAKGTASTPVLALVQDVRSLVAKLNGVFALVRPQ
jgi:hypothetical protein